MCDTITLNMPYSIIVVEDDNDLRDHLKKTLISEGYHVSVFGRGIEALNALEKIIPDLVILDIQLPDISGEELCLEIKKRYPKSAVIFLTANDSSSRIVQGLEIGADDYITKPFIVDELLARIRARLRKENIISDDVLKIEDLILNRQTFEVKRGNKIISLTPKEFKLLEYLMLNKNHVLNKDQILSSVWKYHYGIESRVVDMYISTLRKKVDKNHKKKLIYSVRGFGHMVKDSLKD